jgi:hypothetical protein
VTLAVTRNAISGRNFERQKGAYVYEASTAVDRKSMGHTVAERSWKDADFVCISCIKRGGHGKVL